VHDIRLFRDQPDAIRRALRRRGEDGGIVDEIRGLDEARRAVLTELEALKATRNSESKRIGGLKDAVERDAAIQAMRAANTRIDALEAQLTEVEATLHARMNVVPNMPADRVPEGRHADDNVVVRTIGDVGDPARDVQPHWDIGPALGLIDFERGVRMSGSRFYVLRGAGARLQRALIQWMLDFHASRGYVEITPPYIVREACMWHAGQLPKFRDNLYHDAEEDFWLVPTAEVPLTNLHVDEILTADELPLHYVAYTPCFRREKMSAGSDVRGIKRGHQFDKVEMYKFTTPETSAAALDAMLADGEATLAALGLPYRVLQLCAGDLGFGSTVTYDLEVWAPGCGEWLEVSSISDFGSFQARRANIRYRAEPGAAAVPVHTLNGSGLGVPRTMIAILEHHQRPDGTISVPEVLRERVGADVIGA